MRKLSFPLGLWAGVMGLFVAWIKYEVLPWELERQIEEKTSSASVSYRGPLWELATFDVSPICICLFSAFSVGASSKCLLLTTVCCVMSQRRRLLLQHAHSIWRRMTGRLLVCFPLGLSLEMLQYSNQIHSTAQHWAELFQGKEKCKKSFVSHRKWMNIFGGTFDYIHDLFLISMLH